MTVPTKDEAEGIGDLLNALARQTIGGFEVLMLANNCVDDTAAAGRWHARRLGLPVRVAEITLPAPHDHVGTARRRLAGEAVRRLPPGGAVLTTDADTRPTPDWIERTLAAIRSPTNPTGADCVCGRIKTDPADPADDDGRRAAAWHTLRIRHRRLADRLAALLDPDPHDPWPRHHDEAGRASRSPPPLVACGGAPAAPCSEDVALVAAVRRVGGTVRHDPRVSVRTSRRRDGRCPGGLADLLSRLAAGDVPTDFLVEDPRRLARRLAARGRLRRLWSSSHHSLPVWAQAARGGPLAGADLAARHAAGEPFGAVVADFAEAAGEPAVPLHTAVRWLAQRVTNGYGEASRSRTSIR